MVVHPAQRDLGAGRRHDDRSDRLLCLRGRARRKCHPVNVEVTRALEHAVVGKGLRPAGRSLPTANTGSHDGVVVTVQASPRPGSGQADPFMNISEFFIRRPIATALLMVGILVFGIVGYQLLPVAALPNVDFPTITGDGAAFPAPAPTPWRPRWRRRSSSISRPSRASRR